jgi:hypothetical protein
MGRLWNAGLSPNNDPVAFAPSVCGIKDHTLSRWTFRQSIVEEAFASSSRRLILRKAEHSRRRSETCRAIEQRKWRNDRALFEYRNRFSEQIDLIKIEELPTLGSDAT